MSTLDLWDWWSYPRGRRARSNAVRVKAITWIEARRLGAKQLRLDWTEVTAEVVMQQE